MPTLESTSEFLAEGPWAVVGASKDRDKYGNKVLRAYLQRGKAPVYAVNPVEESIEGVACFPDLASLPESVRAISVITPPPVTEDVVRQAIEAGVGHVWMQPGAESAAAVDAARAAGMNVIAGGPCVLVVLGFRE